MSVCSLFQGAFPRECCGEMRLAKSIRLKDGITAFLTLTSTRRLQRCHDN